MAKDRAELIPAEGLDGLVNGGNLAHVAETAKCVDNRGVGLGLTGKNENFFTACVQYSKLSGNALRGYPGRWYEVWGDCVNIFCVSGR